jgi:hypothetical protein
VGTTKKNERGPILCSSVYYSSMAYMILVLVSQRGTVHVYKFQMLARPPSLQFSLDVIDNINK